MPRLKRHADEDQVAAVADWINQVERDYSVRVRVVSNTGSATGRLAVRVEACEVAGERLVGVRVQCKGSYPSSYATSYLGTLLKLVIQLHKDLEDYEHVCAGLPSSRGHQPDTARNTDSPPPGPRDEPLRPLNGG